MTAPLSAATVNLGTIADSAWSALQSSPSPQTATAYHDAIVAYAKAALTEYAAQADAASAQVTQLQQQAANLVPTSQLLQAEATINQLQAKLQQVGVSITTTPSGGVNTAPSVPGGYTAGQVGAATVGGALFGWLANALWREHEQKTHARANGR